MLIALVRVVILIVAIITVSAACQLLTGASLHPQNEKQNNQIAETHRLWYLITSRQPMSLPCKDTFQMLCTDSLTCCWHLMLSSKIASPRATSAPLSICHYQILIPVLVRLNNRLIALPSPQFVSYQCPSHICMHLFWWLYHWRTPYKSYTRVRSYILACGMPCYWANLKISPT